MLPDLSIQTRGEYRRGKWTVLAEWRDGNDREIQLLATWGLDSPVVKLTRFNDIRQLWEPVTLESGLTKLLDLAAAGLMMPTSAAAWK